MFSHRNPVKRNRNIGTKKAGYKRQSDFGIPDQNYQPFYENIKVESRCRRTINGKDYNFVTEKLKSGYTYTCSVDEICEVLSHCPVGDLDGLSLIILRQPKRKEEIFSCCWGRLQYFFEYNGEVQPAIIIEAVIPNRDIVHKKSVLSLFHKKKLLTLQTEGHELIEGKRAITVRTTFQAAKNTQLYRTLLHEVGHYVFWKSDNYVDTYEEKELYADNYAKKIRDSFMAVKGGW